AVLSIPRSPVSVRYRPAYHKPLPGGAPVRLQRMPRSATEAASRAQRGAGDHQERSMLGPSQLTVMLARDVQREPERGAACAWMFGAAPEDGLALARPSAELVGWRMVSAGPWLREGLPAVARDRPRFGDLQR